MGPSVGVLHGPSGSVVPSGEASVRVRLGWLGSHVCTEPRAWTGESCFIQNQIAAMFPLSPVRVQHGGFPSRVSISVGWDARVGAL